MLWRNNGLWRLRLNIRGRKMELTVKREGSGDGVWQIVNVPGERLLRTKLTGHRNFFVLFLL